MKRDDTIKILSVLRGAYPAFYRDITKQEAESTIALWESRSLLLASSEILHLTSLCSRQRSFLNT